MTLLGHLETPQRTCIKYFALRFNEFPLKSRPTRSSVDLFHLRRRHSFSHRACITPWDFVISSSSLGWEYTQQTQVERRKRTHLMQAENFCEESSSEHSTTTNDRWRKWEREAEKEQFHHLTTTKDAHRTWARLLRCNKDYVCVRQGRKEKNSIYGALWKRNYPEWNVAQRL